jgi:hypothetical protein
MGARAYAHFRASFSEDVRVPRYLALVDRFLASADAPSLPAPARAVGPRMKAILTYHSVDETGSVISIDERTFRRTRSGSRSGACASCRST